MFMWTCQELNTSGSDLDDFYIREVKEQLLKRRNTGQGLLTLFMNFEAFVPYLHREGVDSKQWKISFEVRTQSRVESLTC